MASSSQVLVKLGRMALALMVVLALAFSSVRALNMDQVQAIKDASPEEANNLRLASRQAAMPSSNNLVRFLFYNARDHPSNGLFGYKRSSSALDALTGVTLGKRSGATNEYLNLEPFYNRQFGFRSLPRMYDMRWGPLEAFDGPENN